MPTAAIAILIIAAGVLNILAYRHYTPHHYRGQHIGLLGRLKYFKYL